MRGAAGVFCAALFLSSAHVGADDAPFAQGIASPSPATTAALVKFEQRVQREYARQVARAEARDGPAKPPVGDATGADTVPEGTHPPADTRHLRLRSVLNRMAASVRWQVEQDTWSAGIRLRYSRAVEFDPETASYALIEAIEITPAVNYRIVAVGRPMKVVVRRTGYAAWENALFAPPSRWIFFDRPNRIEEALQMEPGTEILLSNEAKFFLGPDVSADAGAFPVGVHAGVFVSGQYFVRVKRLSASLVEPPGNREWILSAGGLITRGLESALNVRTPELVWHKRLRLFETHWRLPRGTRFLLRAGPVDLRTDSSVEPFFQAIVGGAAVFRYSDFELLGMGAGVAVAHPEIGTDLLRKLEHTSNLQRALAVARGDQADMPYFESLSRVTPRGHGEFGVGLWALAYGLTFASDWYAEESLGLKPGGSPSTIFDFPLQRRWDRGWLFVPRETRDLQIVTVQDGQSDDRYTEVSLEIEDAHAQTREDRAYRAQILRVLTQTLVDRFPKHTESAQPKGPAVIWNELPDLARAAEEDQRVSIYLRLILGPRFHDEQVAKARDKKGREKQITEWQKKISKTIRRRGDVLEELVRTHGTEDLFVSYRIALTPYARRKESPRPTTEYRGSFGDPNRIPSYRRLRDALDDAGTG